MSRRSGLVLALALGAAVLTIVGSVSCRGWHTSQADGAATPLAEESAAEHVDTRIVDATPARRAGSVRPEQPRAIRLQTGTVVPVRAVPTRPDGLLDVPQDIDQAGWWRGGSRLGDPLGSTLLAAHVDSTTQGLGPFAALLEVRRNQRFVVSSANLQQSYRAISVRLLEQGSLLRHTWMYSPSGGRRLIMVTCAPPYVPAHGGYQKLAVVTAVPVSAAVQREK